ncbi:MAG: ABC transporter permease [Huintestinicola sp.]
MRTLIFSKRNIKELIRDPLSYVFCLGFPVIMLLIMTVINKSIPPQANMTVFRIDNLSAGIAVFGLTFIMLFAALLVSKDRTSAFLTRLYSTPMTSVDFIAGYYIPLIILAAAQCIITFVCSLIIAANENISIDPLNVLASIGVLMPSAVMFIGFGLIFGTLFSDKAAPGLCSIIISAAAILGGVWMDVRAMGGGFEKVCTVLPFLHSVETARGALHGTLGDNSSGLIILAVYTAASVILSILVFRRNMTKG